MREDANENETVARSGLSASAQMRQAREAAGMSLDDVANRTRITLRHLTALEAGDYQALPGTTYCAGFSRAYARAVGIDEHALVSKVREEIAEMGVEQDPYEIEEPVDPSSVPPRYLVIAAAVIALLFAGGYAIWRTQYITPPTDDQLAIEQRTEPRIADPRNKSAAPAQNPAQARPNGPVVLTAVNEVWLRIYQPDGKRLFEGTLEKDKSFTVPAEAQDPMILTGRPDALAVTVGGQAIPPLGTAERTISDVPLTAAALLERRVQPTDTDPAASQTSNGDAPPAG
ncbi:cytoskeletal protein RodZ [Sphingobium sp. B11D3B]|uniref:helix-turn-helix domain-containing protein n=1 Tax=unclassified Sphingobium TaxID=2611147 RepID=UPI00222446DE|nr:MULTISPECIES: RodZ domain-containing protein [unclassified Sphingobium]MCW2366506.1 cytoskeletal protein RodZ [Sphingobium sp. B7D2B]MCW2387899.1 cytoskeletal protein RodZ [Sphingobium sp. B11D3B]MCW2394428.1 cytoskeletal protein RodZ [Sphingobium sp. B8D3B]MCW2417942.1 cytoskeletal protein RodZ [Sphingobium sp. B8D3C]